MIQNVRALWHPPKAQISLTGVLYALSDPVRLKVVAKLASCGEASCGGLGLLRAKSSLSHHFKVLRAAGLIATRVEGTQHINYLRRGELEERFPGLLDAVLRAASRMR